MITPRRPTRRASAFHEAPISAERSHGTPTSTPSPITTIASVVRRSNNRLPTRRGTRRCGESLICEGGSASDSRHAASAAWSDHAFGGNTPWAACTRSARSRPIASIAAKRSGAAGAVAVPAGNHTIDDALGGRRFSPREFRRREVAHGCDRGGGRAIGQEAKQRLVVLTGRKAFPHAPGNGPEAGVSVCRGHDQTLRSEPDFLADARLDGRDHVVGDGQEVQGNQHDRLISGAQGQY